MAAEKAFCDRIGKGFVATEFKEDETLNQPVEIEREELIDITCSEDDAAGEQEAKSRKSGVSQKMLSEWRQSQKTESPELFRLKARLRMISSTRKFTMGVQPLQSSEEKEF
mmetsp:Transcript_27215/g.33849  ORF Transcript_27215/g.33849 Transcript_27215/m.33849 type:complete len:111 (+) Transcript_27215:3461-3793(+)